MNTLANLINELESKISSHETVNEKVSASPVSWHIEHALLTIDAMIEKLKKSNPGNYKRTFTLAALYVFTTGKIPRGRTQSPPGVIPKNIPDIQAIKGHIEQTREAIKELQNVKPNNYFTHHILGNLNVKSAKKFIIIHTKHHLRIINDIILKKEIRG
jgi:hypothetical protein